MIVIAIWMLLPYYWTLKTSFESGGNVFAYPPSLTIPFPPHFKNYVYVWNTLNLSRYFLNSIIITAASVFFGLLIALMAAYPLARYDFYGKKIAWIYLFLPAVLPFSGGVIVNYIIISKMHLVNTYTGVVLPGLTSLFAVILFRQAYKKIPLSLEEAARIDGAGEFYIWWRIMTPQIIPTVVTWGIFMAIGAWDAFMWPLIVLSNENMYPVAVALQYLNSTFQTNFRYTSAGLILASIPMILLLIFGQDFLIKGLSEGGIKY